MMARKQGKLISRALEVYHWINSIAKSGDTMIFVGLSRKVKVTVEILEEKIEPRRI